MTTENSRLNQSQQATNCEKKPYEKPAFRFEKVFVTSALSCGKVSNLQSSCQGVNSRAS